MRIEGKTFLLSGATGGLGQVIAEELAKRDAKLILSSRREKELKALAKGLPGGGRRHRVIVADLAKSGAAEKLIRDAGKIAELDGLVANAALPASGKLDNFSSTEIQRALRVNLESPILMSKALAPKLAGKGEGHLVFISSGAGRAAAPRSAVYSATKFGLRGFALCLREDLFPAGVGVSVVSPGFVRDAGLFADSGAKLPPGMGTTTPKKVGRAVVRAIKRNKGEKLVAPRRQKALINFAARRPELAGKMTRGGDRAAKVADEFAAGQTDKR